jgi:hypothetical protein
VQVLGVAREIGMLKLGTVALDGTKIHGNASRHSALSYEHATKIEAQLKAEVADLLGKAEAADQADVPDGMQVPGELTRREKRLAEIARAKAVIEARAKERHAQPTIAFGIPTYWSPETTLAIFEFIDEMRTVILAVHGTHIQDEARRQGKAPPADRVIIPDDELPF